MLGASVAVAIALAGCASKSDASDGTAGSDGTQAAAGSSGSSAPIDGIVPAPGLDLTGDAANCDGVSNTSCSGHCVTAQQETNGCQALATARIFSEVARDSNGTYFSEQRSSSSSLWSADPATGALVQLAEPPGDNMHLRLALDDQLLYFISDQTLYSIPRGGGQPTQLLPNLPNPDKFAVVAGRMFAKVALSPEVDEIDLTQGTTTKHDSDVTSLLSDGNDLYFAVGNAVYRAQGGDYSAATMLASPATTLLGFASDSVYALGGTDTDRAVRRFPKAGGSGQVVYALGSVGLAALANDALAFTHKNGTRYYICTVGLDGSSPTIHGYLSSAPDLLAADEHYIYATFGFNMVRLKR
jgi:hypothetical protein